MLIHNIHLASGMTEQQVDNVLSLVGHSLKQTILPVFALIVDIDLGMLDELSHCSNIAIPDQSEVSIGMFNQLEHRT